MARGGLAIKREFLLGAVAELIAAEAWAWSWQGKDVEMFRLGLPQIIVGGDKTILPSNLLQLQRERFAATSNPGSSAEAARRSLRFKKSDKLVEYSYVPSQGKFKIGMSWCSDEMVSSMIFVRHPRRRTFTPRETKIVDIVGQEVVWLHDPGQERPRNLDAPKLSPKSRLILQLLVQGLNRKAIATRLNISVDTVHTYIKSIYLAYGVNSQAELTRISADTNYGK